MRACGGACVLLCVRVAVWVCVVILECGYACVLLCVRAAVNVWGYAWMWLRLRVVARVCSCVYVWLCEGGVVRSYTYACVWLCARLTVISCNLCVRVVVSSYGWCACFLLLISLFDCTHQKFAYIDLKQNINLFAVNYIKNIICASMHKCTLFLRIYTGYLIEFQGSLFICILKYAKFILISLCILHTFPSWFLTIHIGISCTTRLQFAFTFL